MRVFVCALLVASSLAGLAFRQRPSITAQDLNRLAGPSWSGTLTYKDYGSGKSVTIPSALTVTRAEGDENSWVFEYEYPEEPKANGRATVRLSDGGSVFDGQTVVERAKLEDGSLRIVTEKRGEDDGRRALFRYTYTLAGSRFSIRKEARRDGEAGFFERNVYSWAR
jgi:hypothetical protein